MNSLDRLMWRLSPGLQYLLISLVLILLGSVAESVGFGVGVKHIDSAGNYTWNPFPTFLVVVGSVAALVGCLFFLGGIVVLRRGLGVLHSEAVAAARAAGLLSERVGVAGASAGVTRAPLNPDGSVGKPGRYVDPSTGRERYWNGVVWE